MTRVHPQGHLVAVNRRKRHRPVLQSVRGRSRNIPRVRRPVRTVLTASPNLPLARKSLGISQEYVRSGGNNPRVRTPSPSRPQVLKSPETSQGCIRSSEDVPRVHSPADWRGTWWRRSQRLARVKGATLRVRSWEGRGRRRPLPSRRQLC